jgi:hypothetical protein
MPAPATVAADLIEAVIRKGVKWDRSLDKYVDVVNRFRSTYVMCLYENGLKDTVRGKKREERVCRALLALIQPEVFRKRVRAGLEQMGSDETVTRLFDVLYCLGDQYDLCVECLGSSPSVSKASVSAAVATQPSWWWFCQRGRGQVLPLWWTAQACQVSDCDGC